MSQCQQTLVDLGFVDTKGDTIVALELLSAGTRQMKRAKTEADAMETTPATAQHDFPASSGSCPPAPELHRNFATWRAMPPGWKRRTFHRIEPTSLNLQTKVLIRKAAKEPPPHIIVDEVLEFIAGKNLDALICEERPFDVICAMAEREYR